MRSLGKTIPGGKDSPPAEVPSIGTEFKGMATSSSSSRRESKAPEEVQLGPGAVDFLEFSLLNRWMRAWLKYLAWYAVQSSSPPLNHGLKAQLS